MYQQVEPHDGFQQLLEIAQTKVNGYFVYTSNVDGHFQRAGYNEDNIVECHGSINHFQCLSSDCNHIWSDDEFFFAVDVACMELMSEAPECPKCQTLARPNVLMFDDHSWDESRFKLQSNNLNHWLDTLKESQSTLVILELGAGQIVPTVRKFGESISTQSNSRFIRVNSDEADSISHDLSLKLSAKDAIKLWSDK